VHQDLFVPSPDFDFFRPGKAVGLLGTGVAGVALFLNLVPGIEGGVGNGLSVGELDSGESLRIVPLIGDGA
jgi:hypothetical protein